MASRIIDTVCAINICLILFQLSLFVSSSTHQKPHILSEFEETIVEAESNFTILCEGNTPLTWTPPIDANYSNWTTIEITPVIPKNQTFLYASRIFIQNITYRYTGYYICHDPNVKPAEENEDKVAKIYLYVDDEEHLSVEDEPLGTIIATQYHDVTIPCRPTSPQVNVELTLISGEKIDATYDPKTGFRFFVDHLNDEGLYYCSFLRNDVEYEQSFYLKILQITDSLPKPRLEETSGGHTIVGKKLTLECKVQTQANIIIKWITPTGPPDKKRMDVSPQKTDMKSLTYQQLTINKTTLNDKGTYYCDVSDNQNHNTINSLNVKIFDKDENFINLTEENEIYEVSAKAGQPFVQWRITVNGHPQPELYWLDNKNETILSNSRKYETNLSSTEALLKIKDINIEDYGHYTLVASNKYQNKSLSLFLNVTDKPHVDIEIDDFNFYDTPSTVKCVAAAYPKPTISWSFKPCQDINCEYEPVNETRSETKGLQLISYISIKSLKSGFVKCSARNSLGSDESIQGFYVTDVEDGFNIFGFDSTVDFNEETNQASIAVDETVKMTCGASVNNYTDKIRWRYYGREIQTNERFYLEKSRTEYTHRLSLTIENINFADGGIYSCEVLKKNNYKDYKNVSIVVKNPYLPVINKTNLLKDIEMKLPHRKEFYCYASGVPKPSVTWYKNGQLFQPPKRVKIEDNNQKIIFTSTDTTDEGTYKCEAKNKIGTSSKQVKLSFNNNPESFNRWLIIIIAVLIIAVFTTGIFIVIKVRKERRLKRELQIAGLANFEKGALENLNPELGIDDQAELLPYNKKWEFPIEKLKLGKQLGSGAFGVVMKGEAKGIVDDEDVTTVAVKMVKKNAGSTYIKALASELKIMVHLGKHLNVVNLLGACTKNVAKRELLVIVEYCRYGNLQNYLLRHRENFIDQVDPKTGHINYTIGADILERTYSVSSNRSGTQSPYMKYAALSFSNSNNSGQAVPDDMIDYRGNNYGGTTAKTDITTVSMSPNSAGDDGIVLSNNSSVQPEWRSNYRGDYNKSNVKPICTKDLLAWTFQVARGMEYLASRRVLHGDLAARNILLADNNVVKICDFGLAKSMYKNDNYKKKGDGPLPVKWMAIESIRDKVFSTQSDVWSFGIVLWEFFSLARTPYPGMEADERLYNKLIEGYRMESPDYASKEVYDMMLHCWNYRPLMRPSFSKLAEKIGSMLEDSVRKYYIDLNDPYLVMNTQRLEDGQSDYLAMLSPPNFENLSSPHNYVNDLPSNENTPGYLCMKSASIFSPRADDERIFDFEINTDKKDKIDKNSVECTGNELLPMLDINNESDCENSTCNSPLGLNSFSNPSYHLPPVMEKTHMPEKDIVKLSNNYVNMLESKSAMKDNNPFVKNDKHIKDVNYVNNTSRDWESVKL